LPKVFLAHSPSHSSLPPLSTPKQVKKDGPAVH
jgi:hypothetical protein